MITIPILEINSNPDLAPKNHFGTFVKDTDFIFFESVEERELFMASLPVPEIDEVIEVQAWQLWIALSEIQHSDTGTSLLAFVDSIIDTMVDVDLKRKAKIAREYVTTIRTDSPFIQMMAHEMTLSKEEVKQIFLIAKQIEL